MEEKLEAVENMVESYLDALCKTLPKSVDKEDMVIVIVPSEIVKSGMVERAKYLVVLGFTGRIPNHYEVLQWP